MVKRRKYGENCVKTVDEDRKVVLLFNCKNKVLGTSKEICTDT